MKVFFESVLARLQEVFNPGDMGAHSSQPEHRPYFPSGRLQWLYTVVQVQRGGIDTNDLQLLHQYNGMDQEERHG